MEQVISENMTFEIYSKAIKSDSETLKQKFDFYYY